MKTDTVIKRLRWIMLVVMLVDVTITLVGQPAAYWKTPTAAVEGNPFVRVLMHQGVVPLLLVSILYAAAVIVLVSTLPSRIGLVILLFFTLSHFVQVVKAPKSARISSSTEHGSERVWAISSRRSSR